MKVVENDGYQYFDWEDGELLSTYFLVTHPAYPDDKKYGVRLTTTEDNVITYYTRKFSLRLL